MSNFFVSEKEYKKRIKICKSCDYYFKPTGTCKVCMCFMKIKSRIAVMECPEQFWEKTSEISKSKEIPKAIINEVLKIYPDIKAGTCKNYEVKYRLIEIYNTIFGTHYQKDTNCSSCLSAVFDGIKKIYNENKRIQND
tara:strand:- start:1893 stop:2306 length:414 start_codon:yes stop_codon:yes gene_type:complete